MTSVFTPNIDLEEPARGDYVNDWDVPINSNLTIVDQAFGSSTSIAFTNANVTLSVAQAAYFQIICTGTLTANVQLILPSAIGGRRIIYNQCTGAFTLTVLNGSGDTGGGVVVGQGFQTPVVLTAGRAFYDAYASTPPGAFMPAAFNSALPGFLLCFGQTISRTTYAQLWAAAQAYGWSWGNGDGSTTFTLPDFRGRLLAGADNMGGSAAGRLTGYTVGTTGGAQTDTASTTLGTGNIPQFTFTPSGTVTSSVSGGTIGGTTTITADLTAGAAEGPWPDSADGISVSSSFSGNPITIGNASPSAATSSAFGIVQPTAAINYMIRY